ncbi:hypothetical protein AURDEDRAFT_114317 [Auricularia subglabra TFB-10046 SS5]|nr:hypothetical protein AURDEDRAFT_114317 [Auricularia subglabra TFB-10046 SS5]
MLADRMTRPQVVRSWTIHAVAGSAMPACPLDQRAGQSRQEITDQQNRPSSAA